MKLIFGADISLWHLKDYSPEKAQTCMKEPAALFREADFSMLNLENVFGREGEFSPILKSGPNLLSPYETADYPEALCPTVMGMANNHAGDFGENALLGTVSYLKEKGFGVIGAGKNSDEAYLPYHFEKDGERISVLAVCENEFGTASSDKAGSAGYDLTRVSRFLESERKEGGLPLIFFHGGNEGNPYPSPGKVTLYRHFAELGAGAVIAMHTHCPQGYEVYRGCPIVYSMGNFFFPFRDKNDNNWYHGYLASLELKNGVLTFEPMPYRFDWEKVTMLKGEEKEKFLRYLDELSAPLSDEKEIARLFEGWCMIGGMSYIRKLCYSPDFLTSPEKAVHVKNIFGCEAHNELLTVLLRLCYEGRIPQAEAAASEVRKMQEIPL